jgi:hypothetical protein
MAAPLWAFSWKTKSGHPLEGRDMESSHCASARKHLVERRSALIKSLRVSYQDEQMEAHIGLIVRIQAVIDVIDRASKEETGSP